MRKSVLLSSFLVLLLGSATAMAQERPAAEPTTAIAASTPMDCAAGGTKRHDHGAERNAPAAKSAPCAPKAAASAAKSKSRLTHDHAKFHKNQ